jgi:hypothetical protein
MKNHIIPSHTADRFKFWHHGAMREGITFNGEMYALVDCFELGDRHLAYQTLYNLTEQGIPAVITIGSKYRLWKSLRSKYWNSSQPSVQPEDTHDQVEAISLASKDYQVA